MIETIQKYQITTLAVPQGAVFMLKGPGIDEKHTDLKTARGWRDTLNRTYTHGYAEGIGAGVDKDMQKTLIETMNLLDEIGTAFVESGEERHGKAIQAQAEKLRAVLRERGVMQ